MNGFLESVRDYKLLWLALAALVAVAVFVWVKASAAVRKHNERFHGEFEKAERLKKLSERYSSCDLSAIAEDEADDVIDGFAAIADKTISDEPDINSAFLSLPVHERFAYAMQLYFAETKNGPSTFFRASSHPLTDTVMSALSEADKNAYGLVLPVYEMTDDDNEEASFDENILKKYDEAYLSVTDAQALKIRIRDLIIRYGNKKES